MANDCVPYYEPGGRITAHAAAALTGKRFVRISANRQSGPGLSATGDGGNLVVNTPTAGARVFGVTAHDAASGSKVAIIRGPGFVVPVTAAATIAAFDEVEVNAAGQVIPKAAGVAVGFAVNGAANGADAEIALY